MVAGLRVSASSAMQELCRAVAVHSVVTWNSSAVRPAHSVSDYSQPMRISKLSRHVASIFDWSMAGRGR
jgi:hypothetical protein